MLFSLIDQVNYDCLFCLTFFLLFLLFFFRLQIYISYITEGVKEKKSHNIHTAICSFDLGAEPNPLSSILV